MPEEQGKTNNTEYSWGNEMVWANTNKYSGAMIIVLEGEQTPYIYHKTRDKTLVVLQGTIQLTVEGSKKLLNSGDTYHVHPKIMHRITALRGDAVILEVGTALDDDVVIVEG